MRQIEVVSLKDFNYSEAVQIIKESFKKRKPIVFRHLDIGPCTEKWKVNEYLYEKNPEKNLSVHVASTKDMDFKNKNFEYRNMKMKDFIKLAEMDSHEQFYYLRALGEDVRKEKAHFHEQFPELSSDLLVPPVFANEDYFSSVFRISSKNCRLWTHYDTMDNILIQVRGEKSIIFFSPFDAEFLYLEDGKSPILCPEQIDSFQTYPLLANATPYVAHMLPGDIVFIPVPLRYFSPALWFHNVRAEEFSIAVNVFWYHLSEALYDKKDVYGNKDPVPVLRANQSIDNALKILSTLPEEYRHLYGLSLVKKISSKLLVIKDEHN